MAPSAVSGARIGFFFIRPRLGQRDGGDSDLTWACELDSGG
ncbi:hypothetical protein [Mycobacterium sp. JS623]|nr:hypothetical protein [Mycobacterium sp. JS623]